MHAMPVVRIAAGPHDWRIVPRAAHHARVGSSGRNRIVDVRRRTKFVLYSRERDRVASAKKAVPKRQTKARLDLFDASFAPPLIVAATNLSFSYVDVGVIRSPGQQENQNATNFGQH